MIFDTLSKWETGSYEISRHIELESLDIDVILPKKGPTLHAYVWQIGPFCQDTLGMYWVFTTPEENNTRLYHWKQTGTKRAR